MEECSVVVGPCPLCQLEDETIRHAFVYCLFVLDCWKSLNLLPTFTHMEVSAD